MVFGIGLARKLLGLSAALLLAGLLACGGGGNPDGGPTQPSIPSFTAQPQSQVATEGEKVILSVAATGNGTLSYQWKKGGNPLSGKTATSLVFDPVALSDAASYTVEVTNTLNGATAAATTAAAALTVQTKASAPLIDSQPTALRITATQSASFTVTAHAPDGGTLSYQWRKGGIALTGKTSSSLILTPVSLGDAGDYSVLVTNSLHNSQASTLSDSIALTVDPAAGIPFISTPPAATSVLEGGQVTLGVTATSPDGGALSYQWIKGGTDLNGKTSASLTINPAALIDAGNYSVRVTNALNGTTASLTTTPVALIVDAKASAPIIDTHPAALRATATLSATLSVIAHAPDGGTLSYQWMKGASTLTGKTASSLVINPLAAADAGDYSVLVTNTLHGTTASTASNSATLTVDPAAAAPTISASPSSTTVTEGGSATFSVTASSPDGGVLSYQWLKGTTTLTGKTSSSLVINPVTSADAGSYTARVTNTLNGTSASATSGAATLGVTASSLRIKDQPASQVIIAPAGASLTTSAEGGTPPYTFQWKKGGTNVGTGLSYTIAATDLNETSAQYSVVVTDAINATATSENATITVMAPEPTYAGDPVPTAVGRTLATWPSFQTAPAFPHGSFRFGYDESLKNPAWTAYANFKFITAFSLTGNDPFKEDTRLALPQVGDSDYSGSGWTRGHNVMQSDIGYRYGQMAADDSCRLSNIAPQIADLNNNFWNNLEQAVGGKSPSAWVPGLADKFQRIWIYTGPTFSSTPTTFGTKNIAVPNGFYKIVVYEKTPGQPKALAVLAPHQITNYNPPTATSLPVADIWKYVTSVARVEQLTGLNFFPTPAQTLPTAFKTEVDVLGLGSPFEQTGKPNVHMIEPSWNLSVSAGTTINFTGAASSTTGTVSNPTWTFGSEGTASGYTASHTFNTAGAVSVNFTVTDGASVSNTITRVVTVTGGNSAPAISGIGAQTATLANPVDVPFTVNDDSTPKNLLVVTAASSNQTVLPDSNIVLLSGPDAVTGACSLRLTGTGSLGSATVTVTVKDGSNATTTGSFIFTVTDGNTPPVITGLSAKSTPVDTPITVTFTVSDAETTDAGTLQVAATSSDTTLIPGTLSVANSAGACSLTLNPGAGLNGTATITISVQDGGGKITTGTFVLTVGTPATPTLIISQYYEGTTASRFIEITNVGASTVNLAAPQVYLVLYANPTASTDFSTQAPTSTDALTGTLAPGQSKLYMQSGSTTPSYAVTASTSATALSINGNDPVLLSLAKDTGTAWTQRFDIVGLTDGTNWGKDLSLIRKATVVSGNPIYSASEWTVFTCTSVDSASTGSSERLGEHVYNH